MDFRFLKKWSLRDLLKSSVFGQTLVNSYSRAAQFIYLNRTCWNGLYRVNLNGEFNVPKGTKDSVIFKDDNFEAVAKLLCNTRLLTADFEQIIGKAMKGDFVFIDPPYTVRHNHNGFIKYNENLFSWSDQIRLCDTVTKARDRGAKIVLTNANHESIRELYSSKFELMEVSRFSGISSKISTRAQFTEILIH